MNVSDEKVRFEYRQLCREVSPMMARFRLCEHYRMEPHEVTRVLFPAGGWRG